MSSERSVVGVVIGGSGASGESSLSFSVNMVLVALVVLPMGVVGAAFALQRQKRDINQLIWYHWL